MIHAIENFAASLRDQNHLQPLVANKQFTVTFIAGKERVTLIFLDGDVTLYPQIVEERVDCRIVGKEHAISDLLAGKERLRTLVNSRQLSVVAPYRIILLLESIFFLASNEARVDEMQIPS